MFDADIRWTTHGVAHIRAADWASLGFGQGWACARDHLPTIADQIVKVRGERALHLGPGVEDQHLASDFGYRVLGLAERAPALREAQPLYIRDLVRGYTAGYNAWLAEATDQDLLPRWCAGASWVNPIDELDLYAYLGDVGLLGSGRNLVQILGRAVAPGPDGPHPPSPISALGSAEPGAASNGWAFGGEATASGHGLVMANPHFPWGGEGRFWECHLTIPGELDVYGVSLLGAPGVQMGFNENVGWCHTFSAGNRFTLSRLDLVSGSPTSYRYGDDTREMTPTNYTVSATVDGEVLEVERTLWSSHIGPMVNLPLIGWGLEIGFTYRDANIDNTSMLEQFLSMCRASDMDDFQSSYARVQGMPWVNTLAADRTGRAWYIDASATPNLSLSAQARFRVRITEDPIASLLYDNRVPLLDGSDPDDDWLHDPTANRSGVIGHPHLPQIERRDFVVNANDSHWLTNPAQPLEGYSVFHGFERTARTLRTRQNTRVVQRLAESGDLTVTSVLDALLDNESLSAELLRAEVVARCRSVATFPTEGGEVDLTAAAEVLEAWDGRFDLDSVGATLWREFMAGFTVADIRNGGALFAHPWDQSDPIATPNGLAPEVAGFDPVALAVAAAVTHLDHAGVAIDAQLGDVQWAQRGTERVPVHGGGEADGVTNILAPVGSLSTASLEPGHPPLAPIGDRTARTGLAHGGYRCTYGTSFLMAVELTDDGPRGMGLLAYGQSGDPRSDHHADGTRAYAAKAVRPLLFRDRDIDADPNLVTRHLTGSS